MKALLFPGQGSLFVGMGKDLYNNFDIIKKIFRDADQKLGYNISKIILGFMIATAFLSMFISNTATTVMMLPIAISVINQFDFKKLKILIMKLS